VGRVSEVILGMMMMEDLVGKIVDENSKEK